MVEMTSTTRNWLTLFGLTGMAVRKAWPRNTMTDQGKIGFREVLVIADVLSNRATKKGHGVH